MAVPWLKIASTAVKLSRLALTTKKITDQIAGIQKRHDASYQTDPLLLDQVEQLREASEMQAQMNEQFTSQLEIMQTTLDRTQRSIRILLVLVISAFILSALAVGLIAVLWL